MTWLLIFAALVVGCVAVAVLPRRAEYGGGEGFPWFWIVFPLSALFIALAVGAWLPGRTVSAGADFGFGMYMPLADPPDDNWYNFLSDEPAWHLLRGAAARYLYPALSLFMVGLSVIAWKRRRI